MKYVKYEKSDHIAVVTIARPERLNAYGSEVDSELGEAFVDFQRDPDMRAAILTGEGRAFCAGVDVKEFAELGVPPTQHMFSHNPLVRYELRKPVIAAINGLVVRGGFNSLALNCHIRIAVESAYFMFSQLSRGAILWSAPIVRARIPPAIVYHMALTGEPLSARRAYELGIINKVVAPEELMPEAFRIARKIAEMAPGATTKTIKLLSAYYDVDSAARDYEEDQIWEHHYGGEILEGMRSFSEGRDAGWKE